MTKMLSFQNIEEASAQKMPVGDEEQSNRRHCEGDYFNEAGTFS
jgi:hypothetical protein